MNDNNDNELFMTLIFGVVIGIICTTLLVFVQFTHDSNIINNRNILIDGNVYKCEVVLSKPKVDK